MDAIQLNFKNLLKEQGLELSDEQAGLFDIYYQELIVWNEKINLTAITEKEQVYIKHFYDSLSLAFFVDLTQVRTLADIGSGAGFPSIPLKIMFPHLQVTIVDSLNKRILFLNQLTEKLNLNQLTCVHGRAEDVSRMPSFRDQFDLVTARAVAKLSVLNEFCLPFVKKGGFFVAMKGSDVSDESKEAAYSLKELNGRIIDSHRMELPIEQSVRHLIRIEKIGPTPGKYPRKAGLPLKNPLAKIH
ncbi:16S rRNA (guanine(527)-N(7))-methyltransferase RsmG [Paenibacillus sp. GP183]|jgi:16S rRNA (guanine527-N7)-methyltransferase|uniref:16S rRNA (guanine(527)-N(7))-methyltransferase RsmG n=1 Tax=Paenibacillus sp. GP183 TaxID=1882751 RepID=UPI00089C5518|nr:16S rRNA (guanine(527)-N(7))-methyltransferase RsmG [Paenibacillus sp. GP183]SEC30818.1 16S rRNA m(7)G-527 methyltransferase [Paenibacillus sp. GP183]